MNELIQRNDSALSVQFTAEAAAQKNTALELSGVIGKVTTPEENAAAVGAQMELQKMHNLIEKARKAAKEPVLEYGRKIDVAARDFAAEVDEELLRLSQLIGDFQALEQARLRAAEQARRDELLRIEQEKAAAIAMAQSHEQVEAIVEHFGNKAALEAAGPAPQAARAEGQVVKTDWEITVTNPYELAKFHPGCVNITPRLSEIKQMLNDGVTLKGVTARKITKAGVRVTTGTQALIEV